MLLQGKHIILGVTGSIAAYKAAQLTRLLIKEGAEIKIVVTPAAKEFITPITLSALSKNPVLCDFFQLQTGGWNSHVELGIWGDIMLIAPASANTIAKMAHGICDNLLLTTYLSARCPVFIAPAMDADMFSHPATKQNLQILKSFGNSVIEPTFGELASGLEGKGRMEEPENIVSEIIHFFGLKKKLKGKRVIVTAGPTVEAIDPVRFISNHSSGKMGYSIANCLASEGAEVILISGPVTANKVHNQIKIINVVSAAEMFDAANKWFTMSDAAILAAAVADYTPVKVSEIKIKHSQNVTSIQLEPTRDIAAHLGSIKKAHQVIIGFALETDNEVENAKLKLKNKNLDLIVLNSLNDKNAGFETETNKVTFIDNNNNIRKFELKHKSKVAEDIVNELYKLLS
ncbi:MAG: bifunctional phosphopantothenoylcysteine decarboxylase/phosphopantothenate--cysteine ligase CoaBC [Bacteroidetes bacterium CG23_combo_of_CG06-09_8_20_14_all_32_9]|nr:MAG: bifunctional phosphopantothenoylcysteine decarboxylase/phosphopantothenate--cysteine ligase CoaBC [Bacteroidetes bacterium CG23_combo_of_CG06-09_8_20_14_all_32_9]